MDLSQWLTQQCEQTFGTNLMSVLLLGSSQRADTTPFSDIDVVVVVKTHDADQVADLRSKIRSSLGLIDCSILCEDEFPTNPNEFLLGTHGCYHMETVLKHATCLWGRNVFSSFPSPTQEELELSVRRKLAEYTWWMRRIYVESNRERTLGENYKLNGRLIKMVRDFLFLKGHTTSMTDPVLQVISMFLSRHDSLFLDASEIQALTDLTDSSLVNIISANMSEEYLAVRYSIANKLYKHSL